MQVWNRWCPTAVEAPAIYFFNCFFFTWLQYLYFIAYVFHFGIILAQSSFIFVKNYYPVTLSD